VKTLDLTRTGRLEEGLIVQLNEIAELLRADVVQCIEGVGEGHEDDIDWWVSELASRNTFTSPFFTWCCQALLVDQLLEINEPVEEVLVDSRPLYTVLRQRVKERGADVRVRWSGTAVDRLSWLPRLPWALFRSVLEFVLIKALRPPEPWAPREAIVLVDTFVFDGSFSESGEYADRYYEDFGGWVSDEGWQSMYYWPTLHITLWRTWSVLKALRSSKRSFVLSQDLLTWSDLLYAWLNPWRALSLKPSRTKLTGIDVTPFLRAIWRRSLINPSAIGALLKYRFAMRLRERNIRVRLLIDWFENQSIDKGANLGFRRYHPECMIVGYQGYIIPRHYLAMYPSQQEYDSGVLPHRIAVVGRGFTDDRQEFCPDVDATVAPAFRFSGVWREQTCWPDPRFTTVLVLLHLTNANSVDVLRAVSGAGSHALPSDLRWWIRPHPASPPLEELLRQARLELPPYEIAHGDFTSVLEQSDIVVGNTSSTCLEALTKGVPAAIVAAGNKPAQNPIPSSIPQELWRLCFGPRDVALALRDLPQRDPEERRRRQALGVCIRDEYFEPITERGVHELLLLT
jgi:hypothetical protein